MQESKERIYLQNPLCRAVIISKRPLMREGLRAMMQEQAKHSSLVLLEDYTQLQPEILASVDVVLLELDNALQEIFTTCNSLNQLQNQYRKVQWIFTVPVYLVNIAIERLFTSTTSLLSVYEPMNSIIEHVFNSSGNVERISRYLLQEKSSQPGDEQQVKANLTFSERRVLRLISKGWQLNQIATLLQKNYKTVSAQKSSAMRRLALKTDSEMFAWMISESGMQELNLPPFGHGV